MNDRNAKRAVLVSAVVVSTMTTIRSVREGSAPPATTFLGAGVAAMGLGILAEIAPTFAALLAILWAVGAVLLSGESAASGITTAINRKGGTNK